MSLASDIIDYARILGFDLAAILPVGPPQRFHAFADWLVAGYAGEMSYLAVRAAERADPARLAPDARSIIMLAASYNPKFPPPGNPVSAEQPQLGEVSQLQLGEVSRPKPARIARYAWGRDYHDVLKRRLYDLDASIRTRTGRQTPGKACVDTAPLLERDFAEQAGLGFVGRNTCLITPGLGSWTFLAALLVPEDLSPSLSPGRACPEPVEGGGEDLSPGLSPGKACPEPVEGGGENASPLPYEGRACPEPSALRARPDRSYAVAQRPVVRNPPAETEKAPQGLRQVAEAASQLQTGGFPWPGRQDRQPLGLFSARRLVEGGARGVRCGRCTRCLVACPTHAFVAPYVLDSRRCISYLTIELKGPIPTDLRPLMGNWVFGCDVCQEVCPYNRSAARKGQRPIRPAEDTGFAGGSLSRAAVGQPAQRGAGRDFRSLPDFGSLTLTELLSLDEIGFRARFRGTPVMRAKRRGLVRNACVAAGNAGDPALVPALIALLDDLEPLIRGHAAWALGRLGGAEAMAALHQAAEREPDAWVREEIGRACGGPATPTFQT